ncbi:hypothetical protein C4573_00125 [Candidatus Woesearchaeota archaeon]|nr:MAG: hypothetical protein C4573_00125 [Candidatus Woesearchaeota archaeon]
MPSSLVAQLKELAVKKHFLDMGEQLRSLVREKCMQHLDPYSGEMKKFREELKQELLHKTSEKNVLIKDLKRIVEELSNEK